MNGKQRVIIENVQPVVDGGRYPVKRTVGERVDVSAHIFGDGHDHIRARLHYKKTADAAWSHAVMKQGYNDEWSASFSVKETGTYKFKVSAWIDHFDSWFDGFRKKTTAKLDVRVGLMEG